MLLLVQMRMKTPLMVAVLLLTSISASAQTITTVEDNKQEAERLWELAITAKGGRERLHTVNNLQISTREKVWYGLKRISYIAEDLYVFPGKYWQWNDQRGSVFGLSIQMYNQERDIDLWYTDRGDGSGHLARPTDLVHGKAPLIRLYDVQLRYLMETKWVKPLPVSVQDAKVDGKSVRLVQTIVKGYPTKDKTDEIRIGFALDQKTYLPVEIVYYHTALSGREFTGKVRLSDYVDVGGIKMPSKVNGLKSSLQINVEYDEQIFVREPNVGAGIQQWKKK